MIFSTVSSRAALKRGRDTAYLVRDNWDDYGFKTTFYLHYYDYMGKYHEIGGLKIGEVGLEGETRRPRPPDAFDALNDTYFSLGQDDSYYEELGALQDVTRQQILIALNDIAYDLDRFRAVITEPVTGKSLLRSVSIATVQNQFNRMAHGGRRLTPYSFSYEYPATNVRPTGERQELQFSVEPESQPPTNIHVVIGRNGVGKSHLLNHITDILVKPGADEQLGKMRFGLGNEAPSSQFANVISVAFSAFDDFTPYSSSTDKSKGISYTYIGLKRIPRTAQEKDKPSAPKSATALAREFSLSVKSCVEGARLGRWRRALEMLQSDPIFADSQVADLADVEWADEQLQSNSRALFHNLSSGHKIVLLTITRLVEAIEDRSLVLLDEPESHLHPPLLSAFIRALSDLLTYRNGVAIIATHSPVILQEVPKTCVWKLRRFGTQIAVDKPQLETFGENVGTLTQEIFGLEVTNSGFHKLISDKVDSVETFGGYEEVLRSFGGNLGSEAKAMVRALLAARTDGEIF